VPVFEPLSSLSNPLSNPLSPPQVQLQYAGKGELATSGDARVVALCAQLEAVFVHGLKANKKRGVEVCKLKRLYQAV